MTTQDLATACYVASQRLAERSPELAHKLSEAGIRLGQQEDWGRMMAELILNCAVNRDGLMVLRTFIAQHPELFEANSH